MKDAIGNIQDSNITGMLRAAGYKATQSRILLLRTLKQAQKPLAVADIHKKVGISLIDQATIYRTMRDLVRAGIVTRVDTGHAHTHFELSDSHHHHVICRSCQKIEDVDMCFSPHVIKNTLRKSETFASIDAHTLEFFGLCDQCAR